MSQQEYAIGSVRNDIVEFVVNNFTTNLSEESLPLDQSLVESGIVDSFGVVELVTFLENNWSITIGDSDITKEKMGSINKMTNLVLEKLELNQRSE